jgi:hypothetical protein
MTNKLNELFQICGVNDFIFTYQKEGDKNFVDYSLEPEKKIVVNIPNSDDKELDELLSNKIEELKELFK